MHGDQVAENEYRAYRHENRPGGEPGFQTEQYWKYDGHTDEGSITSHGYIFLNTS